jgi:hypothetical protein
MVFDSRSSWGAPQTLSLRLSEAFVTTGDGDKYQAGGSGKHQILEDVGVCWVDLATIWDKTLEDSIKEQTVSVNAKLLPSKACSQFDEQGELPDAFEGTAEVSGQKDCLISPLLWFLTGLLYFCFYRVLRLN